MHSSRFIISMVVLSVLALANISQAGTGTNFESINLYSARELIADYKQSHLTTEVKVAIFDISFFGFKLLLKNKLAPEFIDPISKLASPHGTSVAQVMAGVNPNIVFGHFNVGTDLDSFRAGLAQVEKLGVRLINISLSLKSEEIINELNDYIDRGGIVVASAGNGAEKLGVSMPEHYKEFKGIIVSAMEVNRELSSFSHYSVGSILAPGARGGFETKYLKHYKYNKRLGEPKQSDLLEGSVSLIPHTFGQTSSSAPMVCGLVSLALEVSPELTNGEIKELLLKSSDQNQSQLPVVNASNFIARVINLKLN